MRICWPDNHLVSREVGPLSVFSEFRRLPAVIVELSNAVLEVGRSLESAIEILRETGPVDDRLEELERTRAHWEAQMEALVLKADSTLKASSNAESRSRTMLRHAEKLSDPLGLEGEDEREAVPAGDVPRGEEEEVQPVPLGLAISPKEYALRAKFG